MPYLAVSSLGREYIFKNSHVYRVERAKGVGEWQGDSMPIVLPKGTIQKLTSLNLAWDDEPMELTQDLINNN